MCGAVLTVAVQHTVTVFAAAKKVIISKCLQSLQSCYTSAKSETSEFKKPKYIKNVPLKYPRVWAECITNPLYGSLLAFGLWISSGFMGNVHITDSKSIVSQFRKTNRKSFKRLVKLLDETSCDSQSVTNVFRMLHPAPFEWQQDKVRMGGVGCREEIKPCTSKTEKNEVTKKGKHP